MIAGPEPIPPAELTDRTDRTSDRTPGRSDSDQVNDDLRGLGFDDDDDIVIGHGE